MQWAEWISDVSDIGVIHEALKQGWKIEKMCGCSCGILVVMLYVAPPVPQNDNNYPRVSPG